MDGIRKKIILLLCFCVLLILPSAVFGAPKCNLATLQEQVAGLKGLRTSLADAGKCDARVEVRWPNGFSTNDSGIINFSECAGKVEISYTANMPHGPTSFMARAGVGFRTSNGGFNTISEIRGDGSGSCFMEAISNTLNFDIIGIGRPLAYTFMVYYDHRHNAVYNENAYIEITDAKFIPSCSATKPCDSTVFAFCKGKNSNILETTKQICEEGVCQWRKFEDDCDNTEYRCVRYGPTKEETHAIAEKRDRFCDAQNKRCSPKIYPPDSYNPNPHEWYLAEDCGPLKVKNGNFCFQKTKIVQSNTTNRCEAYDDNMAPASIGTSYECKTKDYVGLVEECTDKFLGKMCDGDEIVSLFQRMKCEQIIVPSNWPAEAQCVPDSTYAMPGPSCGPPQHIVTEYCSQSFIKCTTTVDYPGECYMECAHWEGGPPICVQCTKPDGSPGVINQGSCAPPAVCTQYQPGQPICTSWKDGGCKPPSINTVCNGPCYDCPAGQTDPHFECKNGICAAAPGCGSDQCESSTQCSPPKCNENNKCVATGTGALCSGNDDCETKPTRCNANKQCVQGGTGIACDDASQCQGPTKCNVYNQCVPGGIGADCNNDNDCENKPTRCNAYKQCVEGGTGIACNSDSQCKNNPYACNFYNQCVSGASGVSCGLNADCSDSSTRCNGNQCAANGTGIACTSDTQCQTPTRCSIYDQCVVGGNGALCTANSDCQNSNTKCNGFGQCVVGGTGTACNNNSQCQNTLANCNASNQCVPGGGGAPCTSNTDCSDSPTRCNSSNRCATDGAGIACSNDTQCQLPAQCNIYDQCVPGGGGKACDSGFDCQNSSTRCNSNNQCATDGIGVACDNDNQCQPTETRCNTLNQCVFDGTGALCDNDAQCEGTAKCTIDDKCEPGIGFKPCTSEADCVNSDTRCDLNSQQCTANGTGPACGNSKQCQLPVQCGVDNKCLPFGGGKECDSNTDCENSLTFCDYTNKKCTENGEGFACDNDNQCKNQPRCTIDGECQPFGGGKECNSSSDCNGPAWCDYDAQKCSATGYGWACDNDNQCQSKPRCNFYDQCSPYGLGKECGSYADCLDSPCKPGETDPHYACVNGTCGKVYTCGVSDCSDCPCPPNQTNPHSECVDGVCSSIDTCGVSDCSDCEDNCPPNQNKPHLDCVFGTCTRVNTCGVDDCSDCGSDCPPNETNPHLDCVFGTCTRVNTCGVDDCSECDNCLPNETNPHLECVSGVCTSVNTCGVSDCSNCDGNCPPNQTNPHLDCVEGVCTSVNTCGTSDCSDCEYECPPNQTNPHFECAYGACISINTCGVSDCPNCPTPMWCDYDNKKCSSTGTSGVSCTNDVQCKIHPTCDINERCVVCGGGIECNNNADCENSLTFCDYTNKKCAQDGEGFACDNNSQCGAPPRCDTENKCSACGNGKICTGDVDCEDSLKFCNFEEKKCVVSNDGDLACDEHSQCDEQPTCDANQRCVVCGGGIECNNNADCENSPTFCDYTKQECTQDGEGFACDNNSQCGAPPRCDTENKCSACGSGAVCESNEECIESETRCVGGKCILSDEGIACDTVYDCVGENDPPYADNLTSSDGSYCTGIPGAGIAYFKWNYQDPDNDHQSSFTFQVDNDSDFSSPEVDRTFDNLDNPAGALNQQTVLVRTIPATPSGDFINYGVDYYWRVIVAHDNPELSSEWIYYDGSYRYGFLHPAPSVYYTFTPANPEPNKEIYFQDFSACYYNDGTPYACINIDPETCRGGENNCYTWRFGDSNSKDNTIGSIYHTYESAGTFLSSLQICDEIDCCSAGQNIRARKANELPKWREISPF